MTNATACLNMVKQQLRTGDVLDETILSLYETLPRASFLPQNIQAFAYSDMQLPIGHQQRMLSPLEEGLILQALALEGHETVLEIGTGTGYFTALLSRLCKQVITVDYFAEFTQKAKAKLTHYQCTNVEWITGDAHNGWLDKAPYDVVVMTGAVDSLTESHRLQILPGGKLIAIVGKEPVMQCILASLDHENNWTYTRLFDTCIPPLIDQFKPKEFVF